MGVLFKDKCAYFAVPNNLYDSGRLAGLSHAAQALLSCYYHAAHRASSFRFATLERVVKDETGMCANTQRKARAQLVDANLIRCEQGAGGGVSCIVHLVNPESQEPFEAKNGKPAMYTGPRADKLTPSASRITRPRPSLPVSAPRRKSNIFDIFDDPAPHPAPVPTLRSAAGQKAEAVEHVCAKHGNRSIWYDSKSDDPHCGICDPSIYAPPVESPASRPSPSQKAPTTKGADSISTASDMTADGLQGLFK